MGFAQGGFDLVDPRDGGEWSGGEGLAGLEGFMELAPGVGPAGDEDDAVLAGNPGVVGGVGVGLQIALIAWEQVVEAGGFAAGVPLIEDVSLDAVARGVDDPEVAGGAFSLAGVLIADGCLVRLEVGVCEQAGVDEFVDRLAEVGADIRPVAEGVAREVDAVAPEEDAMLAVEGKVVAVFSGEDLGDEARGGAESEGGGRGGFDRNTVRIVYGDVNGAGDAGDENHGRLEVVTVGGDAVDFTEVVRVGLDGGVDDEGFADFEVGVVAGLAGGALFGEWRGEERFSRRWRVGSSGVGVCGEEIELGGIEGFAFGAEELAQDLVDALAQQFVLGAEAVDFGEQVLFALRRHLL